MSLLDRNSDIEVRGHETHFPDVLGILFVLSDPLFTLCHLSSYLGHCPYCGISLSFMFSLIGFNWLEEPGGNEKMKSKIESKVGHPPRTFPYLLPHISMPLSWREHLLSDDLAFSYLLHLMGSLPSLPSAGD